MQNSEKMMGRQIKLWNFVEKSLLVDDYQHHIIFINSLYSKQILYQFFFDITTLKRTFEKLVCGEDA